MKIFSLIYQDSTPYLRVKNPIENDGRLISRECWQQHDDAYTKEAIKVLNPTVNQREYFGAELEMLWRFTEDGGETWIEVSEPNFIGTELQNYEQVFKVKPRKEVPFQERVSDWVRETFDESVLTDIPERNHRLLEEVLELLQATGMTMVEIQRLVVYTFNRPPGEIEQELGGVMVTLAALSTCLNLDMNAAAETELANNWKRKDAIREKRLKKIAPSPINQTT